MTLFISTYNYLEFLLNKFQILSSDAFRNYHHNLHKEETDSGGRQLTDFTGYTPSPYFAEEV